MKTSESIKNLTKALLTAQKQMGAAVKGAKNPFFKSSYADLPTVMEVVKEPLNEAGIIVLQPASTLIVNDGSGTVRNYITTTLIHAETGEWISSDTQVVSKNDNNPQDFGAAQTYARRFGLQSLLFIPAEDDDGNSISGRNTAPAKTWQQTKPTVDMTKTTGVEAAPVVAASGSATTPPITTTTVAPKKTSSFRNKAKPTTTNEVLAKETDVPNDWQ